MKVLFLFHDDWHEYVKADLLASQFPVDGFVVVERKRDKWNKYLWKRAKRIGFGKVLDELALRLYWVLFKRSSDERELRKLMNDVREKLPSDYQRPLVHKIRNINSEPGRQTLRELKPDVCVLMVHPIISRKTFSIPPLGMLVFHPGITPEYRGPHPAFWATFNREFWGIGWSLLRIDEGIDTGFVLAQESCRSVDPLQESHVLMQHKSHVDGIPKLIEVLRSVDRGEHPRVEMIERCSTNYTHPGMTDYVRYKRILAQFRRGRAPQGARKPKGVR